MNEEEVKFIEVILSELPNALYNFEWYKSHWVRLKISDGYAIVQRDLWLEDNILYMGHADSLDISDPASNPVEWVRINIEGVSNRVKIAEEDFL